MGSRPRVIMPSLSTTSLMLPRENINASDNIEGTSTSPTSIHSASTSPNLLLPTHSYFTRFAVQRFKRCGTPHPYEWCSANSNTSRSSMRNTTESRPGCSRTNSSFLSRSCSSVPQDCRNNLHDSERRTLNDLAFTLSLPRRNFEPLDINLTPCDNNQICATSKAWKFCLTAFLVCIVVFLIWYVNQYFKTISTEIYNIKDQMERMKSGAGSIRSRKDTKRKLDMIENHLNNIKKSQQESTCLAGCIKDSLNVKVQALVKQTLAEYNADKTGKTDFALESTGGSIVGVYETEPYDPKSTSTLFGIQMWQGINGPISVIQASTLPGECWAFKGSSGSVIIKLLGYVIITGVSLEHISKTISPSGEIDNAPKDFSIWGLDHGTPGKGRHLGKFKYDVEGTTLQFFPIECSSCKSYLYVHFHVHSNHGNPTFTCVYRLRVHGTLDKDDSQA